MIETHYYDNCNIYQDVVPEAVACAFIFPEDYGAKGDGITDDADAIQTCIAGAETTKKANLWIYLDNYLTDINVNVSFKDITGMKKVNNNIIEYITFIKLIKRGIYYGKSLQLQRRPVNIT